VASLRTLDTRKPPSEIFRIGRKPDPWQPPDWSRAQSDGTFGNRFDDPLGYYRVLYASTQRASCFIETLARFRPDLTLLSELSDIEGENDFVPLGVVPQEWCDQRMIGAAEVRGEYAEIYATAWIAYLRIKLADECLRLGLQDLDASVIQSASPRRITQLASRQAYEAGYSGIFYLSRYGHDLENWAIFEPFPIHPNEIQPIRTDDPDFLQALDIFGLRLSSN
jgi:RES domain